jgi:predicted ester cyclase
MDPTAENCRIAHQAIEDIWNQGNLDAVDTLYADEFVEHGIHPLLRSGSSSYKHWISSAVASFPYERVSVEELYASGDKVAARYVVQGCHIDADKHQHIRGLRRAMKGSVIMRISGGRITESWGTARLLELLCQCE